MDLRSDRRIDPEPISVVVMILSAAGSIAALVDFTEKRIKRREERRQTFRGQRRIIRDSLFGARLALAQLRRHLETVRFFVEETDAARDANDFEDPMELPTEFGNANLYLTRSEVVEWEELQADVLESIQKLQRNINRLVVELASSDLHDLPRDRVGQLQKAVARLNRILGGISDSAIGEVFDSLEEALSLAERGIADMRYNL